MWFISIRIISFNYRYFGILETLVLWNSHCMEIEKWKKIEFWVRSSGGCLNLESGVKMIGSSEVLFGMLVLIDRSFLIDDFGLQVKCSHFYTNNSNVFRRVWCENGISNWVITWNYKFRYHRPPTGHNTVYKEKLRNYNSQLWFYLTNIDWKRIVVQLFFLVSNECHDIRNRVVNFSDCTVNFSVPCDL